MKQKYLISFLLLIIAEHSYSQETLVLKQNAIESSTGFIDISNNDKFTNPAKLILTEDNFFSVNYSPSRFGMPELSPFGAGLGTKFSESYASALSCNYVGNYLYNEYSFDLAGAYSLTDDFAAGISMDYSRISIKSFNKWSKFMVNVGGIVNITEKVTAGFCLKNINRGEYSGNNQTVFQKALFGFGLKAAEGLNFEINANILSNDNNGISLGCKYKPFDFIAFRFAGISNPKCYETGISLNPYNGLNLIYLVSFHDILGYSQNYGLAFNF